MKQTAVEWLFEKLWNTDKDKFTWYAILKQAKEMEKEQLSYFYIKGVEGEMSNPYVTNIEFYNKTFKKTEQ